MATLTNNLYPPLIADTQVPFIRTSNYKIYFTLSQYNNAADIKNVQISLTNQRTNMSVLNPTKYPSSIKLAPLQYDANKEGDYKYYVEIVVENSSENNDLISDYFEANQYYIVQLRFTSVTASDPPLTGGLDTWLYEQRNNFSEWSNISLLKGINQPILYINNLTQNAVTQLPNPLTKISGRLYFLFSGRFSTEWVQGTLTNDRITLNSNDTTRICTKNYIDISSWSNVTFKPAAGYKYAVIFYNSNKTPITGSISFTNTASTQDITSNMHYMKIIFGATNNTNINVNVASKLSITYTELLGNESILNSSLGAEYLKSYNIKIYKTSISINNLIYKSQEIYTNQLGLNEINYEIPYDFDRNINYKLVFIYKTNNLFTETINYDFIITADESHGFDAITLTATAEPDNGRIKFDVDFTNWRHLAEDYSEWVNLATAAGTSEVNQQKWLEFVNWINSDKNLIIKRSSSKTNFKIWNTLKIIPHTQQILRNVWYDTTIESGSWYKYRIEQEDEEILHRIGETDNPVMCVFEDIFLTNKDKQLRVQFNPTIGELKYNVMDSQQTTLGSQYPYIRRNGNMYYRSFSIGGLISALSDNKDWYYSYYSDGKFRVENKRLPFTSPIEMYGDANGYNEEYNLQNNINDYQDYIYEREFRKKVSEFLYENNIKLFRSLTEGNMLIRLQNVTFQPMNELGRRLYSFSATAIEMDDLSITNYNKYNLINKYYYAYQMKTIVKKTTGQSFMPGESIVTDIETVNSVNSEVLNIFRLDIQLNQTQNAIFYVKTFQDSEFIRYETQQTYLRLQFDDILIICILLFLYNEKIKNEGLFICLIMLLLT